MLNLNGEFVAQDTIAIPYNNRAFSYGDALFETLKYTNNSIVFFEDHYFRLMASMRMLRMEIPADFTLEFLEKQILDTIAINELQGDVRIRLQVFRKRGGLYLPKTHDINYLVEVEPLKIEVKENYEVDLYKDFYIFSGLLSTLKTTNKMVNVLASIYADENHLDNCILINENKHVVELTNANIFLVQGNDIKTPALDQGCIKGVLRKKVIEMLEKSASYTIEETSISPFELQKTEALFCTNAIMGIQAITKYRKKEYDTTVVRRIKSEFENYYKL